MTERNLQKGFSAAISLVAILVIVVAGLTGWFVYKRASHTGAGSSSARDQEAEKTTEPTQHEETASWTLIITKGKAFSMRVPDGWKITNYPKDYIGSTEVVYSSGTPAVIESSTNDYAGHSLRFRASVTELDDAGLGPQWESPQPGLEESVQNFSIGTLQGKRYKGVFSQNLNQTLYEYVFDLGNNRKLDIVYAIYHDQGGKDDVVIVEKAIKTMQFNN